MSDNDLIEALNFAKEQADNEGNISLGYLLELTIDRLGEKQCA